MDSQTRDDLEKALHDQAQWLASGWSAAGSGSPMEKSWLRAGDKAMSNIEHLKGVLFGEIAIDDRAKRLIDEAKIARG